MSVQAKVRCITNSAPQWGGATAPGDSDYLRMVRFTPVYDADPEHPNFEWSQATPSGYFEMTVTNPAAFEKFEVGDEYLVTFDPA